jgi:hypothetical protein
VLGLLRRRLSRSRILLLALLPRDEAEAPHPREWPNMYTKVQLLYCSPCSGLSFVAAMHVPGLLSNKQAGCLTVTMLDSRMWCGLHRGWPS